MRLKLQRTRAVLPLLVTVLLWLVVGGGGCQSCTAIGCESFVEITLAEPLNSGIAYLVEVELGGDRTATTVVPFSESQTSPDGHLTISISKIRVTDPGVSDQGPYEMSLRVTEVRTDTQTVDLTQMVTFERVQPNGRGCPPVCWQAQVQA